ncbi:MAG TPA: hypothetical protein VE570_13115 [Thermoleophilaceae bacterium]|jgi:hypothetical protein|nr:hypothetical protein [Thermoleophilaceae bacterium]
MARRLPNLLVLVAVALVSVVVLSGCGKSSNKPGETVREGLSTPLGGLRYTVFLTRQLNLKNEEDMGYAPGRQEAPPGKGLYGVFLEACNKGKKEGVAASRFYIEDTQGNRFEPQGLGADNPFAYHGGAVPPANCEPRRGSLAQQGPTSGAMLLFELPLAATENRPLELHIEGAFDAATGKPSEATVILDI